MLEGRKTVQATSTHWSTTCMHAAAEERTPAIPSFNIRNISYGHPKRRCTGALTTRHLDFTFIVFMAWTNLRSEVPLRCTRESHPTCKTIVELTATWVVFWKRQ